MSARNIASNLPDHWITGMKPADAQARFESRVRDKMIETVEGFGEAWVEEIESQLHYNEHKNEKKYNPPAYYDARNRLFDARRVVRAFLQDQARADATRAVSREMEEEALAKFASPAHAFKQWLVTETQLYFTAVRHPERVFRLLCSPDAEVYTKRYAILAQAFRTLSADGLDAAFQLWNDELEARYAGIHGEDISTFVELEGRSKYSGGKTGYWLRDQSAMRPILVTDPDTIKRNKEEIARSSERKARANRFDYEVEIPVAEAPKRPRGRPKGVKNKPKPRLVSKEVAAWQAEADRKFDYRPQ